LPWILLFVAAIEMVMARQLPDRFSSHEVDGLIRDIQHNRYNPRVVLLGDSVGYQIFQPFREKWPNRFAALASNTGIEMAGQYFLIKRHLQRHEDPHAVIFLGLNPLGLNLDQKLTENYVQRCFTQWNEIAELTRAKKSLPFSTRIIIYKLFTSYKYRLHLQKKITGRTNADIYTGGGKRKASGKRKDYGIFRLIQASLDERRKTPISDEYFVRLLKLLKSRGIKLYYIPAPLPSSEHSTHILPPLNFLRDLAREYDNLYIMEELQMVLEDERFGDGTHPDKEGLVRIHEKLDQFLWDVRSKERPEYRNEKKTAEPESR